MKIGKFLVALFLLVGLLTAFGCSEEITNPSEEVPPSTPEEAEPFMTVPSWLQGYWAVMEYNDIVSQTLFMDAKIDDLNFPDDPYVSTGFYANELGLDLTPVINSSDMFSFRLSKAVNGVTAIDILYTFTKNSDEEISYYKKTNGFTIFDNIDLHRIKYKVTFDPNGGTISPSNSTKIINRGRPYGTLPASSRDEYTFSGWSLESDGSGSLITAESIASIENDTTLYAVWTSDAFILSFDSQAVDIDDPDDKLLVNDTSYGTLPVLTREGYGFGGWWTGEGGTGTQVIATTTVALTANQTVYAKWLPQYMVIFDSQGGSDSSPTSKTVSYSQAYGTLPTPTKDGYGFGGWWTGEGGTGTQIFTWTTVALTANQTVYAKWLPLGPSGGYIFYENPDYETAGWRYLEAAPAKWSGSVDDPRYVFGYYRTSSNGSNQTVGTGTRIGSGKENTELLVAAMKSAAYSFSFYSGSTTTALYAAKVCADLVVTKDGVVYDDWFLPSKDELNEMYQKLQRNNLGGFSDDFYLYWSSSEVDANDAWSQNFSSGASVLHLYGRTTEGRVRPVRAF